MRLIGGVHARPACLASNGLLPSCSRPRGACSRGIRGHPAGLDALGRLSCQKDLNVRLVRRPATAPNALPLIEYAHRPWGPCRRSVSATIRIPELGSGRPTNAELVEAVAQTSARRRRTRDRDARGDPRAARPRPRRGAPMIPRAPSSPRPPPPTPSRSTAPTSTPASTSPICARGVGGYPLLLVHGYPETKRIWWRNVRPLAEAGYEVVVPDLRATETPTSPRRTPTTSSSTRATASR